MICLHTVQRVSIIQSDRKIVYEGYRVEEDTNGNRIRTKKLIIVELCTKAYTHIR